MNERQTLGRADRNRANNLRERQKKAMCLCLATGVLVYRSVYVALFSAEYFSKDNVFIYRPQATGTRSVEGALACAGGVWVRDKGAG